MRKLSKILSAVLISGVCMSSVFSLSASAADIMEDIPVDISGSILIDDADMLMEDEESVLTDKIQETAGYIDMNVLVYVSGTAIYGSGSDTQMFCEELCFEHYDRNADSVVLYLDLAGHGDKSYAPYDYIYTSNRARFYYPGESEDAEDRISEIFSTMNPYLSRGNEDIYNAVLKFLGGLESYYDEGPSDLRYFYVPDTGKYVTLSYNNVLKQSDNPPKNWGLSALIGIAAALVISIITFFCIKSRYKFKSAPSSLQYLRADGIHIGQKSDVFIRKYQIRTKREPSGGGRAGGGSGGTRSGGGGGGNHR